MKYDNFQTITFTVPDKFVLDYFDARPDEARYAKRYIDEAVRLALFNRYLAMTMDEGKFYERKG